MGLPIRGVKPVPKVKPVHGVRIVRELYGSSVNGASQKVLCY